MTALALVRPCLPPTAHSCDVLARYYRTRFAWPAVSDEAEVWLRLGDVVDTLTVRAALAVKIDARLGQSLLGAPVIELSRGDRVFLTQRRTPLRQSTWDHLARIPVRWSESGSALRLPRTDEYACDIRWWRHPVPGAELPPWITVVSVLRSAAQAT